MEKKRNLWVIPTDKPSRLHYYNHIIPLGLSKEYLKWKQGRNIYITSEEEIKEGQNYIGDGFTGKNKFKWHKSQVELYPNIKKDIIILTTDKELIKDGVQAIDDEFLEWFVKNPSCESVEVSDYIKQIGWESDENGRDMILNKRFYEIIIPKGEPKQCDICKMYPRLEGTNKCESCYSVVRHVLEQDLRFKDTLLPDLRKKEETLEEAAERMYSEEELQQKINAHLEVAKDLWLSAIKEQKRMYSEEEVVNILVKAYEDIGKRKIPNQVVLASWFKQFKKK